MKKRRSSSWLTMAALVGVLGGAAEGAAAPENGTYELELAARGGWQRLGALAFGKQLAARRTTVPGLRQRTSPVVLRLSRSGRTAAQIDAIRLGGRAPSAWAVADAPFSTDVAKLVQAEADVVDAARPLRVVFRPPFASSTLVLVARVEPERLSGVPFRFPPAVAGAAPRFYRYRLGSRSGRLTVDGDLDGERLGRPFFRVHCRPGSGHPPGHTFGWVRDDGEKLYVAMDFTPDNTLDGDKDYAEVLVRTARGVERFRVSVPDQRWGRPGFSYTARALYQHKVYELALPLARLRGEAGDVLELAFHAYGTAEPDHGPEGGVDDAGVDDAALPDLALDAPIDTAVDSAAPDVTSDTTASADLQSTPDSGASDDDDDGGCGCAVGDAPAAALLPLILLLLALRPRRRP